MASTVVAVGGAAGDDAIRGAIDDARKDRDTLGGTVQVTVEGLPPGLGSYASKSDRLDGQLASTLLATQAVKAVEIGDGLELAATRGSEAHDEIFRNEDGFYRETKPGGRARGGHDQR